MNIREILRLGIECGYWLIIAALVGVPFVVSLYILATPRHQLLVNWQNFRMRRTRKVLKDHHFKNMPRILGMVKFFSLLVLIASTWTICWMLGVVDYWPPKEWLEAIQAYL